jgi:hypothetical protein
MEEKRVVSKESGSRVDGSMTKRFAQGVDLGREENPGDEGHKHAAG